MPQSSASFYSSVETMATYLTWLRNLSQLTEKGKRAILFGAHHGHYVFLCGCVYVYLFIYI